jgi:hypothetical protein
MWQIPTVLILFSASLWFLSLAPLANAAGNGCETGGSSLLASMQKRHLVQQEVHHRHRFRYGNNRIDVQTPQTYYFNITTAISVIYNASDSRALPACSGIQWMGSNGSVHGRWYRDEAGLWAWEPERCRLRRLGAAQASACLAGRRVVTTGDSVSR